MENSYKLAINDIYQSCKKYNLIHELSYNDIKQRYRRTILGPLWISLGIAATILGLGILFGFIFNQKNVSYLPYLAVGMVFWTFISGVISEGCDSFIAMQSVIKQIYLPYSIYVFRVICRNLYLLAHNLIIIIVIFQFFNIEVFNFNIYVIPQFILGIINLVWMAYILAIISTRYRDINPIINNGLQLIFYLTPIIWMTEQVKDNIYINTFMNYNPFYYIIMALRSIIEGNIMMHTHVWILLIMAIGGFIITFLVFSFSYKRIAFWL